MLILSIPFGVLVGILIGLGRMSADNEMVAMRSTGISTRVVVTPVMLFAFLATLVSAACSLWYNPLAVRHQYANSETKSLPKKSPPTSSPTIFRKAFPIPIQ